MKVSSVFTFGVVLIAFACIQGWVLMRMFMLPRVFTATEAFMMGEMMDVRVPLQGMVQKVLVKENEPVMEDQTLFIITRTVTDTETQSVRYEDMPILAVQPGIVTDIQARPGLFVQSAQKIATIVNNSAGALHVSARLAVPPGDVPRIQKHASAKVQANFLFDGRPVDAFVTNVDPVYDARTQTLGVRLAPYLYPDGIENLPLGIPVDAWVEVERAPNDNIVMVLFQMFSPHSEAQDQ